MKMPNRILWCIALATCIHLCCSFKGQAQSIPQLTIVSPSNETIISPGQRIKVVVEETGSEGWFMMEGVSSKGVFHEPLLQTYGPRREFELVVPEEIDPGTYSITAIGVVIGGGGKYFQSSPVNLVVPGTLKISRINVNGDHPFTYVGQNLRLDTGEDTDHGPRLLENRALSFKSLNESVASVDKNGVVTAQGAGTTKIVVSYEDASTEVPIIVKATGIKGDLLGHGQVNEHDVELLKMSLNRTPNGVKDARDLNHDGVIDEKDIQIEESLCTYPNCTPHK